MSNKHVTILVGIIIGLSLFGFADSAFLLAKRLSGEAIPCVLGFTGCDIVSQSPYSAVWGIPLSLFGVIFYLGVGLLGILYLDLRKKIIAHLVSFGTLLGFILSVYFIYVQKFLIKAFCVYCIASAIIATILCCLGIVLYRKVRT